MYQINDLVLYSTHGICKITDITEKNFSDEIKSYYELTPLKDLKLQIHIPVGSTKIQMFDLIDKEQALTLIESFKHVEQITFEKNYFLGSEFRKMFSEANRPQAVTTIYSLLARKKELLEDGKKFPMQETKALANLQGILYNELAIALNNTFDEVEQMIEHNIAVSQ